MRGRGRALRHGRDQHPRRAPVERADELRLWPRLPIRRGHADRRQFLGAPAALAVAGGMGAFGSPRGRPGARVLNDFALPKPGDGPTPEQREKGNYDLLFLGAAKDGRASKPTSPATAIPATARRQR